MSRMTTQGAMRGQLIGDPFVDSRRRHAKLTVSRRFAGGAGDRRGSRRGRLGCLGRVAVACAVAIGVSAGWAVAAEAHAMLESTDPPAGAILNTAPRSVSVTFSEDVVARDDDVRVVDGGGRRVDTGRIVDRDGGRTLQVRLEPLRSGGYAVTWRVVSADGHPISGAVTWRVGTEGEAVDAPLVKRLLAGEGGSHLIAVARALQRTALFIGLLVLVGSGAFVLGLWPGGLAERRWRQLMVGSLVVTAVATVVGVGLEAADGVGLGLTAAFDPGRVGDVLSRADGRAALARLGTCTLLALLGGRLVHRDRIERWVVVLGAVLALVLAGTLGYGGHARTGRLLPLALPVDIVHVVAVSVWLGGLVVLSAVAIPRLGPTDAWRLAKRFSTAAAGSLVVVVATGVAQAVRRLDGGWTALWHGDYGNLLIAKIVVVALLVALGARSRSLIGLGRDQDWSGSDARQLGRLRQMVGAEAVVAATVLVVTSVLVTSDPNVESTAESFSAGGVDGTVLVDAVVAPARSGPVVVHLYVSDTTATLMTPLEVTAEMTLPGRVAAVPLRLEMEGPRHWIARRVEVPMTGRWRLVVHVVVDRFEEHVLAFDIDIR